MGMTDPSLRQATDSEVREAMDRGALAGEDTGPGRADDTADIMGGPVRFPGGIAMPVQIERVLGFGRSFSFWPLLFGLACCAIEMMALGGSRFDMSRFGMEAMRASPRQADGMIVAGWCSIKMAPRVVRLYEQIPDPKWVLAMGVCASSGGMFNNYAVVQGVDHIVPVDIYLPGCPPRPEMLLNAILALHAKIAEMPLGVHRAEAVAAAEKAALSVPTTIELKGLLR